MTSQPAPLDPITLTVLHNRFEQIAEEMDIIFDRAAFSPIISEGRDRASGIFRPEDGKLIAQGMSGMPIHIGAMQFAVETIAGRKSLWKPGDIILINDPYLGGTHLMDVKLVMPVFHEGELFCFLGSSGHWPDIGGSVPGGFVTKATEVQQEGLRIPGVRLYREGVVDDDLLQLVLCNVRVPRQRMGDLQAQVASLRIGEQGVRRLIADYGAELVTAASRELHERSRRLSLEAIRGLTPGTYAAEDHMDNDGVVDEPLWVRLDMTVREDGILFDFSRSSPTARGPLNAAISTAISAVYVAFKHAFPQITMNAGCFEPLEVIVPPNTFLNASYPVPVSGAAAETSSRVVDVVFAALNQAMPEGLHGTPVGTALNLAIGGFDPGTETFDPKRYIFYFYTGGGYGGYPAGDGHTNGPLAVGLAKTPTIEVVEQQTPIVCEEYALRADSCGPGSKRGGFGIRYRLRLMRGEARLSLLGDRAKRGPAGAAGGKPGSTARVALMLKGKPYRPEMGNKDENVPFVAGDTITVETPGGGGWGPPAERSSGDVAADLAGGYITPTFATAAGWSLPPAVEAADAGQEAGEAA